MAYWGYIKIFSIEIPINQSVIIVNYSGMGVGRLNRRPFPINYRFMLVKSC